MSTELQLAQHRERQRRYRAGMGRMKPQEVAEEVEWLLSFGESPHQVAKQLGRSIAGLDKALLRIGRFDLAHPFERELLIHKAGRCG